MNAARCFSPLRFASLVAGAALMIVSSHAQAIKPGHVGARIGARSAKKPPKAKSRSALLRSPGAPEAFFAAYPAALRRSMRSGKGAKQLTPEEITRIGEMAAQLAAPDPIAGAHQVSQAITPIARILERIPKAHRRSEWTIPAQIAQLDRIVAAAAGPALRARGESTLGLEVNRQPGARANHVQRSGRGDLRNRDAFGIPYGHPPKEGYEEKGRNQQRFFEAQLPAHARMPKKGALR